MPLLKSSREWAILFFIVSIAANVAAFYLGFSPSVVSALMGVSVVSALMVMVAVLDSRAARPDSPAASPETGRTRPGHENLRLLPGYRMAIADFYHEYYAGPDAPDWSDQFHMLPQVYDSRRITILRQDRDGEYWAFYLFRNDLTGLARDGCHRQYWETFQKVHGDERLSDEHLFVVRG